MLKEKFNSSTTEYSAIRTRTPELIRNAFINNTIPIITSRICVFLLGFVDALFASRFIGTRAVAAITLLSPFIFFNEGLFDLFVSGTLPIVTRYKSVGENKKAARAFGAILLSLIPFIVLPFSIILIFKSQILGFFTDDKRLLSDAYAYFIPFIISFIVADIGMCLERGFRSDGRARFFSVRGVLTSVLNILFNFIAVVVIDGGILGLSIASLASTVIGFLWSESHFFSKKCTIRPELTVLFDFKETVSYIKEELEIGANFAVGDGVEIAVKTLLTKALLYFGGAVAITCYGLATAVSSILEAYCFAVQGSYYQFSEFLYSDKDKAGLKTISKLAVQSELVIGTLFIIAVTLFPNIIASMYDVTDMSIRNMLPLFITSSSIVALAESLRRICNSQLITSRKNSKVKIFDIVRHLSILVAAVILAPVGGPYAMMIGICLASIIILIVQYRYIQTAGLFSELGNSPEIANYSYTLSDFSMTEISEIVFELFRSEPKCYHFAPRAALLVEECNRLLLDINSDNKAQTFVDMRISVSDESFCIAIFDNGRIFNPVEEMQKYAENDVITFSSKILLSLSPDMNYSRLFDINVTHLIFKKRRCD